MTTTPDRRDESWRDVLDPDPVTKLNWNRPPPRTSDWRAQERFWGSQKTRRVSPLGFPAKHRGVCRNCNSPFTPGTLVKFDAEDKIVHGRGCPAKKTKPSKQAPLAG